MDVGKYVTRAGLIIKVFERKDAMNEKKDRKA